MAQRNVRTVHRYTLRLMAAGVRFEDLDPLTRRLLKLAAADGGRRKPSRAEAAVRGNEEDGIDFVCLLCEFTARTYSRVERHATAEHPARAVRIEQRGLL